MHAFREVATAAYCPRKLYYRRREPTEAREPPPAVRRKRALAFRYPELLTEDAALAGAPVEPTPTQYRSRLGAAKARVEVWDGLVDPPERDVLLTGKDCRGVAHKRFPGPEGPSLSLVFTGRPPEQGVWEPQRVRLVAAALALAWEQETNVERVYAEYPVHGVVRSVPVGPRRRGEYRAALRATRRVDGPPARVDNDAKCGACEYREECRVRTRSLRSLLGG